MADPHHVEALDTYDRSTVTLYRTGLVLAPLAVGGLAAALLIAPGWVPAARWAVLLAVALIVANLHLYAKTIRYAISASGWLGALGIAGGASLAGALGPWIADAGLGFLFVVLSGVALKERYCFRLPIVVGIPPALALALIPLRADLAGPAAVLLVLAAAGLALLAAAKLRMPLHYDIGNKQHYQV